MVPADRRPSGSWLRMFKGFSDPAEARAQAHRMMLGAPHTLPVGQLTGHEGLGYFMPVAEPGRRDGAGVRAALTTLTHLHAVAGCRPPGTASLLVYHAYVEERAAALPADSAARPFVAIARQLFDEANAVSGGSSFTHGDATLDNFVEWRGSVYAIDLATKPAPGDRELDVGKMLFSVLGFDTLDPAVEAHVRGYAAEFLCDQRLLKYYLASHVVRVASRLDPKLTPGVVERIRHEFA